MKPLIIIDIDGTITNFREIDRKIIYKLFQKNPIVMLLDQLLWKINSLDYITNSFWIFKFRIYIYSLLSFSSFKIRISEYKKEYLKESKKDFDIYLKEYHSVLKNLGLDILLLSHDEFACYLGREVHSVKNKKKYVLKNIYGKYDIVYMVGNNYMDDIKLGLQLRKKRKKLKDTNSIKVVYIGKSKYLIDWILLPKGIYVYDNIRDFVISLIKE